MGLDYLNDTDSNRYRINSAILGRRRNKRVHLSLDGKLNRILYPMEPAGYTDGGEFNEPNTPRVCVSGCVIGALQALYPNVSRLFKELDVTHLDFHVYTVEALWDDNLINPEVLRLLGLVHDAHITKEWWFLQPINIKRTHHRVRLYNPKGIEDLMYRPFNNEKHAIRSLGPSMAKCRIELL